MSGLPPPINSLATISPPSGPVAGQIWNSYSAKHVRPPKGSGKRALVRRNAQEQTVWIANGYWWNMHTDGAGTLSLMEAPVGADITQSAIFYGSISGSTLTVFEPARSQSPDLGSPIQAGMTVHSGAGAVIQPFGTNNTTGQGGAGTYALATAPGSTTVPTLMEASWWTMPVGCIGNGNGGVPGTCAHSFVYVEGSTLYCYFVATSTSGSFTTQNTYVATAALGSPLAWIAQTTAVLGPQGNGTNGNVSVYKSGSTYYLFQEALASLSTPIEGNTTSWEIYVATAISPTAAFTVQAGPLLTLRPTANGSASHLRVIEQDESGNFIAVLHGQPSAKPFPTLGYRAITQLLAADAWTLLDNRKPFIRPNHPYEVDQIADIAFCRSPSGVPYLFWTAADNYGSFGSGFNLMCAPLGPTPMQYDGWNWVPAVSEADEDDLRPRKAALVAINHLLPSKFYGGWAPTTVSGGAAGCLQSGGAQNEYVGFDVQDLLTGTYSLDLLLATGPSNGILSVMLDDAAGHYYTNVTTQRNVIINSANLLGANWTPVNVSIAAAAGVVGVDGASGSPWLITATSTGALRINNYYAGITNAGDPLTLVCYLKAGTTGAYLAAMQSSTVLAYVAVDANGTVRTSGALSYSVGSADANGWRKVTLTVASIATTAFYIIIGPQNNTGLSSGYPACGTSGLTMYAHKPKIIYGPGDDGFDVPTWESLSTVDTYSASPAVNVQRSIVFDVYSNETMRRNLKLTMSSKNASSSGYQGQLLGASIRRLTV